MKFFLFLSALATSATASAHSIFLDTRLDMQSSTYQESSIADQSRMYFKTGRIDASGDVMEGLKYRVRWAFNKNAESKAPDSSQTALEYGFLTQKLSDRFSLTLGKFNTDVGGFEGATSGADLYLTSEFYSRKGVRQNLNAGLLGTLNILYMTGAKLEYGDGFNKIHLMVTNETGDASTAGVASAQNAYLTGLMWRTKTSDGSLQTNVSYHRMNGVLSGDIHHLGAVGAAGKWGKSTLSLDLLSTQMDSEQSDSLKSVSVVGKWTYGLTPNWFAKLELTATQESAVGTQDQKDFRGTGVVFEYLPKPEQLNFRYHFAYNRTTESEDLLADAVREEIVVGTRIMYDFLK